MTILVSFCFYVQVQGINALTHAKRDSQKLFSFPLKKTLNSEEIKAIIRKSKRLYNLMQRTLHETMMLMRSDLAVKRFRSFI